MDDGHRRWDRIDKESSRPAHRPAAAVPTGPNNQPLGQGPLQAEIVRTIAAIEVPAKEEVAKSVAWVTERISGTAGAGLAAQANVQAPRALALLTDAR
jgi:hypothetical protein